jgi:hypothetical protein
MATNFTKLVLCLIVLSGLFISEAQSQVYLETGKIGIQLSNAGSIRLYAPTTDNDRHLQRVTIIAALSEKAVCDYTEDHNEVMEAYQVASPTIADNEAIAVFNSTYANLPPKLSFRVQVFAWNNEPFVIARYTVINDSSQQVTLNLGAVVVPRIAESYGGETDSYDAAHKVAYCYRTGETPHAGLRLLSGEPVSYHALDYVVYSPDDPSADAATDSTRYHMTVDAGFDSPITASGDGSIFSLNAGAYTLAPGDSTFITYAVAYAETEVDLQAAVDAAKTKYDNVLVSAEKRAQNNAPVSFSLAQNFPNPFNPTTTIQFNLDQKADVTLAVYNLQGQLVNTVVSGSLSAGSHNVAWDGKDKEGNDAGSGVYIYRLIAGETSVSKKMIVVR